MVVFSWNGNLMLGALNQLYVGLLVVFVGLDSQSDMGHGTTVEARPASNDDSRKTNLFTRPTPPRKPGVTIIMLIIKVLVVTSIPLTNILSYPICTSVSCPVSICVCQSC